MLRSTTLRTTLPVALTRNIQANVPPVKRFISTTSVLLNEQTLQEDIRSRLKAALKTAMKAKEKDTAGTVRVSESSCFELGQVGADHDRLRTSPISCSNYMLHALLILLDFPCAALSMIDMGSRHRQAVMSDITYHEKSQSDPNAAASEDTVIDVLRRSVDKRVSPVLS
jgi:hypothetical protein